MSEDLDLLYLLFQELCTLVVMDGAEGKCVNCSEASLQTCLAVVNKDIPITYNVDVHTTILSGL